MKRGEQKKINFKKIALIVLFSISLTIFILLFSYKMTVQFSHLTIEQRSAVSFLENKAAVNPSYTATEISHLEDAKIVLLIADYAFYISLLLCTLIIAMYERKRAELRQFFFWGGVTTIAVMSFVLIFIFADFNLAFVTFHKIFFPQGNWIFSTDSLLIQTFPESFFVLMGKRIFLQAFFWGSLFIVLAFYLRHVYHKKSS